MSKQRVFKCAWCGRLYVAQSTGEPHVWKTSHLCKEMKKMEIHDELLETLKVLRERTDKKDTVDLYAIDLRIIELEKEREGECLAARRKNEVSNAPDLLVGEELLWRH